MKYTVTYAATGGLTVEATSEDEAIRLFWNKRRDDALEELTRNDIEITDVFAEED